MLSKFVDGNTWLFICVKFTKYDEKINVYNGWRQNFIHKDKNSNNF